MSYTMNDEGFLTRGPRGKHAFAGHYINAFLTYIFTRKERNNGVLRHSHYLLKRHQTYNEVFRFGKLTAEVRVTRLPGKRQDFTLQIVGDAASILLDRINGKPYSIEPSWSARPKKKLERAKHVLRQLMRPPVLPEELVEVEYTLPTLHSRKGFRRQYRHWEFKPNEVLTVVARAVRIHRGTVAEALRVSEDARHVKALVLRDGFAIQLWPTNRSLVSVEIWCTKDNTSMVYRRLRNHLRSLVKQKEKELLKRHEAKKTKPQIHYGHERRESVFVA